MFRSLVLTDLMLEMCYWFKFVSVQCIVGGGGGGAAGSKILPPAGKGTFISHHRLD